METESLGGIHAVESILTRAPTTVQQLLLAESRNEKRLQSILQIAKREGIATERLDARELDRRYPQIRHQGIVAICRPVEPMAETSMLQMLAALDRPGFALVLDGITDPHNLGALLRSADAAGVDVVISPKDNSAGITPVVRKVASGAADSVPFCPVTNLARTLAELKDLGYWIYGAADEASEPYNECDYSGPVALVMGAEGSGLRRLTRQHCDVLISIPMAGAVSSLNVSVAAGICLFEVVRQRKQPG